MGIGITNPGTMLDVGGTGTFRASNTTSYQSVFNVTNSVTTDLQIWIKNNSVAICQNWWFCLILRCRQMLIKDNGNVGRDYKFLMMLPL